MNSVYGKYFTKVALIWSGCFVLFFLIYMFVLTPQKKEKISFEKQLAEKKRMYDFALKASQDETKIRLSEEIEQIRNKLKTLVIDYEDSANLTFDISRIASEIAVNSFSIATKKVSSKSKGKSVNKYIYENGIDIGFTVMEFNQFAALLNALERHQPVIFVDRFSIGRSRKSGSEHQVRMNLTVFVRQMQSS